MDKPALPKLIKSAWGTTWFVAMPVENKASDFDLMRFTNFAAACAYLKREFELAPQTFLRQMQDFS